MPGGSWRKCGTSPGLADLHINQVPDYPSLQVDVDRTRAANLGISARDVAQSALVALSSSSLFAPSFYLNPANNVNYTVAVQVPLNSLTSIDRLRAVSMTPPSAATLLQSGDFASSRPGPPDAKPDPGRPGYRSSQRQRRKYQPLYRSAGRGRRGKRGGT